MTETEDRSSRGDQRRGKQEDQESPPKLCVSSLKSTVPSTEYRVHQKIQYK